MNIFETIKKKRKEKKNVGWSEVNLSPLTLPCSRIPLVQGGQTKTTW